MANMSPAGLEGGVVACGVSLVDAGTVLNVIGDQDHRAAEGAHLGVLCVHLEGRRFRSYFSKPVAYMEPALIVIVEKLHIWTSSMICSLTPVQAQPDTDQRFSHRVCFPIDIES